MGILDVILPWRRRMQDLDAVRTTAAAAIVTSTVERERIRVTSRAIHAVRPPNGYNQRGWEPNVQGSLWGDFLGDSSSADREVRNRLRSSRERSRRMARTNPYANRFFALYLANVIGEDGLRLKPRVRKFDGTADDLANRRLVEEWDAWGQRGNCTLDGENTWREVEDLLATSWQRDGEALLRLILAPGLNRWGFVVEPIEADRLDLDLETDYGANRIRMGIEFEANTKRRVAYWILNAHPGDTPIGTGAQRHTRIPASEIIHLYSRERIGQSRGVPRLEAGMARLQMLGGYEEAEVVAARAASSKFGVIKTQSGSEYEGDDVEGAEGSGGNDFVAFSDFGQGTIEQLGEGQDFQLVDPTHPTTQYGQAVKGFLRGIAAATPVNYNSLANDLEGVNYSSLRHATLEERDQWRREQNHFASQVSQPVFERFLAIALATDTIAPLTPSGFDRYRAVAWGGKRWQWIDPLKEAQGNAASLPFYGKTITEIAQERGRSISDIAAEVAQERTVLQSFGLEHPIDRPDVTGQPAPPVAPDAGAGGD